MSSKERSRPRRAVTSRNNASMIARRSPSSAIDSPLVVLIVRISGPEALDGARLVGVDFDEVLRPGQVEHRLDAFLHARQLQLTAGAVRLPIQVHQAPDRQAHGAGGQLKLSGVQK